MLMDKNDKVVTKKIKILLIINILSSFFLLTKEFMSLKKLILLFRSRNRCNLTLYKKLSKHYKICVS